MTWNVLQISDALDLEFTSALSEIVPTIAWLPERRVLHVGQRSSREELVPDPPCALRTFPVQRGFTRLPARWFDRHGYAIGEHLRRSASHEEEQVLVCTAPYFAPVAEQWQGPVVYWLTDRIENYQGVRRDRIHALDRRMCVAATLVCPNSTRLAEYLQATAGCPAEKIFVSPNATRQCNLLDSPSTGPAPLPADVAHLARPIVGVIGNMAGNLEWPLIHDLVARSTDVTWLFVGPTAMPIADTAQSSARARTIKMVHTHFIGKRPYGELAAYARSFDAALLPYRRCEPTFSGSSTRFYEHLAAGRPMIATKGFEELLHKEPLLTLVDTVDEALHALEALKRSAFNDGHEPLRWMESRENTWQARATRLVTELAQRRIRQPATAAVTQHENRIESYVPPWEHVGDLI